MSSTLSTLLEEEIIVHSDEEELYYGVLSDYDDDTVRLKDVKRLLPEMDNRGEPKVNSEYLTNKRKSYDFVISVENQSELKIQELVLSRSNIKFVGKVSDLKESSGSSSSSGSSGSGSKGSSGSSDEE